MTDLHTLADRIEAGTVEMQWIVERFDDGCAVYLGKDVPGCPTFSSQIQALEYAIACETDWIEILQRNRGVLRAQLRKARRRAHASEDTNV